MEAERLMSHDTAAEEDRPEIERGEKRKEEKQETAEETGQMEEKAMAADQAEVHRDRSQNCVEKEENGPFRWEEWEWEGTVDEVGSVRGASEPREGEVVRRQDDGQDEGGRMQGEVVGRQDNGQDEGGRAQSGKRQDRGDWRQYEDEREEEGDMRQEGDDRRRGAGAQGAGAQMRSHGEESSTREEKEKGVPKGGERVNLEDCLRSFKLMQREQQRQGDMEESQERDWLLEQRQERREETSERQDMGRDEREE